MEQEVLFEKRGKLGIITLHRPKKLNSLTRGVIEEVRRILEVCKKDETILAILFQGSGEKAFCAGGDIVSVIDIFHREGKEAMHDIFVGEYGNCLTISRFPKPVIAYMHGIVMGGGAGIARGADVRLVTETTRWAMPEMRIGLFPDVGLSYYFPKMKSNIGAYLATTARMISGDDCCFVDLATEKIDRKQYDLLVTDVVALLEKEEVKNLEKEELTEQIHSISKKYALTIQKGFLEEHEEDIARVFSLSSMESIVANLEKEDTEFAKGILEDMKFNSPLSMKVTLEQLKRTKNMHLEDCYKLDLFLVEKFFQGKDLYEGVRAILVDKTKDAKWEYNTLEEIPKEAVLSYFE